MRKKYLLISLLSVATMVAAALGLTACGGTHVHTMETVSKQEATCTEAGHEEYFKCNDCKKLFSDKDGKTEIQNPVVIAAKGHSMTKHDAVEASCTEDGSAEYYTCANEEENVYYKDEAGLEKLESISAPATGHEMTEHDAVPATCTEDGTVKYFTCVHEDETIYYADEEGTETLESVVAPARGHRIRLIAEKAATCSEAGLREHYECANCKKMFTDEEGKNETTEETLEIPASGEHDFGFTYTADTIPTPEAEGGTLARVCSVCGLAGEDGAVNYRKGFAPFENASSKVSEMEEPGLYYGQLNASLRMDSILGFVATKAGRYTLTFTDVFVDKGITRTLCNVWIDSDKYATIASAGKCVIFNRAWSTGNAEKVAQWGSKILLNDSTYLEGNVTLKSVTFVVSDEDLTATGKLYIKIKVQDGDYSDPSSTKSPEHAGAFLVDYTFTESAVATTVSLEQVALLPSKRED